MLHFIRCTKCNGTLLKFNDRTEKLVFRFGVNLNMPPSRIAVLMDINNADDLQMQCLKADCRQRHPNHWNIIRTDNTGKIIVEGKEG